MGKTLILGIGNTIRGDDAAGIFVAQALRAQVCSCDIIIEEAQESGIQLLGSISGYERAILIDSISTQHGIPGDIYRFSSSENAENYLWRNEGNRRVKQAVTAPRDLLMGRGENNTAMMNTAYSSHSIGLFSMIKAADTIIEIPAEILVYAIEIEKKEFFSLALSQRVKDAVSLAADLIGEELHLLTV
jgi:Ni,Fe-hydrogenase maturation factor